MTGTARLASLAAVAAAGLVALGAGREPLPTGLPRVRTLLDANRWNEAVAEALSMVQGPENSAETDAALGEALWRAGRLVEAVAALSRAAEAEGADGRTLAAAAIARAAEGDTAGARGLLERALALSPEDPYVLYRASMGAPDRATAVEILERYLRNGTDEDTERIQGARHTIELYRLLGERPVWIVEEAPDRVSLPLRAVSAGGGRAAGYVVEAAIGERKRLKLLLDTGASGLFAVERAVAKGGFTPLAADTVFGGGGDGSAASKRGLLPKLSFGGLRFRDALVNVSAEEIHPSGAYHGVIGLSVFSGYRITLDLDRGRLLLDRADGALPDGAVRYWTVSGQMVVEAGPERGDKGLMVFDTGAVRSVLSKEFARAIPEARIAGRAATRGFAGPYADAELVRGVRLEFQGLRDAGDSKTAVDLSQRSRIGGVELSGLLGMDVLDGAVIVVDPGVQRLHAALPGRK